MTTGMYPERPLERTKLSVPSSRSFRFVLPCGTVTCQAQIWMEIPGIPTGFNTPMLLWQQLLTEAALELPAQVLEPKIS